jgi:hypothetical protein
MLKWFLMKLIQRERDRQISLYGYDAEHDDKEMGRNPYHLLEEAQAHYNWGHPIQALAIMQAQKEYGQRVTKRMLGHDV